MLIGWSSKDKIRFSTLLLSRYMPGGDLWTKTKVTVRHKLMVSLTPATLIHHIKSMFRCTENHALVSCRPKTKWVTTCEWSEEMNHTRQLRKPAAWCFLLSEPMNSLSKAETRLDQGGKRKHWGAITCPMRSGSGCFCIWCQQSKRRCWANFRLGDRIWLDGCFSHPKKKKSPTNRNLAESSSTARKTWINIKCFSKPACKVSLFDLSLCV